MVDITQRKFEQKYSKEAQKFDLIFKEKSIESLKDQIIYFKSNKDENLDEKIIEQRMKKLDYL